MNVPVALSVHILRDQFCLHARFINEAQRVESLAASPASLQPLGVFLQSVHQQERVFSRFIHVCESIAAGRSVQGRRVHDSSKA